MAQSGHLPLPCLQQVLAIAKFDPGMCEIVETFSGTATENTRKSGERRKGLRSLIV
jgi:hypothetical protein